MSLAPYRDTKLSSRSQAHLGFYDTHIYEISTLAYFALSVELPARSPNWQVLLHLAEHSFSPGVTLSKRRQVRLVKIEFQSIPRWSNRWIECHRDCFDSRTSRVPGEPLYDHDFMNFLFLSNFDSFLSLSLSTFRSICVKKHTRFARTLSTYLSRLSTWKLTYMRDACGLCSENLRLYYII